MLHTFRSLMFCALAGLACPSIAQTQATPSRAAAAFDDTDRVVVTFRPEAATLRAYALSAASPQGHVRTLESRAAALGGRRGLALRSGNGVGERSQVVRADGLTASELAMRLSADPEVESAVPDRRMRRLAVPNDALFSSGGVSGPAVGQWYLRATDATVKSSINAVGAWDITKGSASVIVAVIDTGITTHPDFTDTTGASKLVLPSYDFISDCAVRNKGASCNIAPVTDPTDPGDWVTTAEVNQVGGTFYQCNTPDSSGNYTGESSSWHGTQTAGIVGAATDNGQGMAGAGWNVRVLPVRVLGKCFGYTSDIAAGIRWAAGLNVAGTTTNANKARVINLSLGSDGACDAIIGPAVTDAINAGVVVVAAAGNSEGKAAGSPANCPGVIGVAGVRHVGSKVGFSDVGPEISIAAPGGNCVNLQGACLYPILTTINTGTQGPVGPSYTDSFNTSVGTSFSSPLVAAAAALMLSVNSSMTPAAVRTTMQSTARAFPASGLRDANNNPLVACHAPNTSVQDECYCTATTCGAGMLDAAAAVAAAASSPPPGGGGSTASGGGGGAMSWAWLLALFAATMALALGGRAGSVCCGSRHMIVPR
jgi:serine protease